MRGGAWAMMMAVVCVCAHGDGCVAAVLSAMMAVVCAWVNVYGGDDGRWCACVRAGGGGGGVCATA